MAFHTQRSQDDNYTEIHIWDIGCNILFYLLHKLWSTRYKYTLASPHCLHMDLDQPPPFRHQQSKTTSCYNKRLNQQTMASNALQKVISYTSSKPHAGFLPACDNTQLVHWRLEAMSISHHPGLLVQ
jgi:hypothetical protein